MNVELVWVTDPGMQRKQNEDACLTRRHYANLDVLVVVCDGMGGHAAGHTASTLATETFADALGEDLSADLLERLHAASAVANSAVFEASRSNPAWSGMGSTLVAVALKDNLLGLVNVGDSPGYLIRGGQANSIAQDHSWPAEQVRMGMLKPEEAKTHPMKHRLTRAIGIWDAVPAYAALFEVQDGDMVLLCSDGVETAGLEPEDMVQYIEAEGIKKGLKKIVDRCRELGAPDNLTISIAKIHSTTMSDQDTVPFSTIATNNLDTQPLAVLPSDLPSGE